MIWSIVFFLVLVAMFSLGAYFLLPITLIQSIGFGLTITLISVAVDTFFHKQI
jgi:hypothetical protein